MSEDTGYAPKSPDLTSFYSADTTPHNQQLYQHRQQPTSSQFQIPGQGVHCQAAGSSSSAAAPGHYSQGPAENQILASAYSPPVGISASHSQPFTGGYPLANEARVAQGESQIQQAYGLQSPSAPIRQPCYRRDQGEGNTSPIKHQTTSPYFAAPVPHISTDTASYQQPQSDSSPADTANMPPRRNTAALAEAQQTEIDQSPVRTKFPTARIKRIMQADDEVGKVAQQTPIAVGKALELFMVSLVTKSADVAREKNSKRVSAQMLKQVVESDEQFDFLHDTVSKVENEEKASKGGRPPKNESESDEEAVPEKKKGRPGRKRKARDE